MQRQGGGSCGGSCGLFPPMSGGRKYTPNARDLLYLAKWKRGESIGFTMVASLKAKGLIPRTSKTLKGKKVTGSKYRRRSATRRNRRQSDK